MTPRRRTVFGVWVFLAASASRALADTPSSVVLLSPADDLIIGESATRLAAELATAGFGVVKASCVVDDDQCSPSPRTVGGKAGTKIGVKTAEIKLWRAKGAATILVTYWRDPDTAVQKRFAVPAFDETPSATFLAIQAFDLFQLAAGRDLVKRDGPAADGAAREGETGQPRFALELGGAVIPSFGGGGPGIAGGPAARAWLLRPRYFAVALALVGPVYSSRLEGAQGTASLRQENASLLVCYRPFPEGRLQPSLCGGGGIYHAAIDGRANQATVDRSQGHWTAFSDIGLGTFIRVSSRFMLSLQARSLWLKRYPQILIGGEKAGETGHPALLLAAAIGRVF